MQDPAGLLAFSAACLIGLSLASAAALKGWRGWLELKRLELSGGRAAPRSGSPVRRDLAELRERVKRLEAIASGIDL